VPGEVRRWDRPDEVKVLWFTVEGSQPVLDLRPGETVARFRPLAFLRHDWPFAWSVPGRLQPANDDSFASPGSRVERPFGTQRYQVRVEIVDPRRDEEGLVPKRSFSSLGPDRLLAEVASFPAMTQALPGAAGPASAVFGLTQIRPPEGEGEVEAVTEEEMEAVRSGELSGELVELTRRRVAFATLPLLREMLDAAGVAAGDAPWRYVSLDGSARWGEQVHAGDLLRVGRRVVVLYADAAGGQGAAPEPAAGNGVLDRDDLVFDYAFGAVVRPLSDVFAGEGGQVEWIPLGGRE
jgi:hypothetical protein